jgi:exonuclease VII large subunit
LLLQASGRLPKAAQRNLKRQKEGIEGMASLLRMADPEQVLRKGYALVLFDGKVITRLDTVELGAELSLRMYREQLKVRLEGRTPRED